MRFLKLCVIAAAFVGLCGLAGCTKEEPAPTPETPPEASAPAPAPETPPAPAPTE